MTGILTDWHFWLLIGGYWTFSAAVGAMPEPTTGDSKGYRFAYQFLHTLAGNLAAAFANRVPGITKVAVSAPPDTTVTVKSETKDSK